MLRFTPVLTWSGTLPFVVCLFWLAFGLQLPGVLDDANQQWQPHWFFISYSVVILSFMAGSLWGKANHRNDSSHAKVLLLSNGWALLAWLAVLILAYQEQLVVALLLLLASGYWHLFVLEKRFFPDDSEYLQLRLRVTLAVILAHGLMLLLVI